MRRNNLYYCFQEMTDILGAEQMLDQIFEYMRSEEMERMLEFIARVNDLELE